MPRSKLELQIDVLKTLKNHGLINCTQIMYNVNICSAFLKQYLERLIEQGLVEKRTTSTRREKYVITPMGLKILGDYEEFSKVFTIT
jgi:predicted transcriptional regulator